MRKLLIIGVSIFSTCWILKRASAQQTDIQRVMGVGTSGSPLGGVVSVNCVSGCSAGSGASVVSQGPGAGGDGGPWVMVITWGDGGLPIPVYVLNVITDTAQQGLGAMGDGGTWVEAVTFIDGGLPFPIYVLNWTYTPPPVGTDAAYAPPPGGTDASITPVTGCDAGCTPVAENIVSSVTLTVQTPTPTTVVPGDGGNFAENLVQQGGNAVVSNVSDIGLATNFGGVIDHIIGSFSSTPISAAAATGSATSSTDTTGAFDWVSLEVVYASITGSYSGCTIATQTSLDGVNFVTVATSPTAPANGATIIVPFVNANPGTNLGSKTKYVYNCTGFGTGGTITLTTHYQEASWSPFSESLAQQGLGAQGDGGTWHETIEGFDGGIPVGVNLEQSITLTIQNTAGTDAGGENLVQVAGNAVATAASGAQLVGIEGHAGTSLESTNGVLDMNIKNVANTSATTAGLAGLLAVGGAGASNSGTVGNPIVVAAQSQLTGQVGPTAGANIGNSTTKVQSDVIGDLFVVPNGPDQWSCNIAPPGTTATTSTLCERNVDAGFNIYVSSLYCQDQVTDAGTFAVVCGAGANCDGGTTTIWGPYTAGTATPLEQTFPIALPCSQAGSGYGVCIQGTAKGQCTLTGEIRP